MEKKSFWEIILMPLVVAIIGFTGTYFVTQTQIKSSRTIAKAQEKIKIIEIFSDKITKNDESERALAIKILTVLDSDLGEKITTAIANTSLDVKRDIDGMESSIALEVKAEIKKNIHEISKGNSVYLIGYYGLNVTSQEFYQVLSHLNDSGYTIVNETLLTKRPDWLANKSTVLYYANDTKEKAQEIARQLSETAGVKFKIQKGAGLGVPVGQEGRRMFIHFVK